MTTTEQRRCHHKRDLCACGREKMATSPRCKTCSNKSRAKPKRTGPPPLSARSRAALQAGDGAAYLRARARDWGITL